MRVTATFIKETGVEVNRPDTQTAEMKKYVSLLVAVAPDSSIWIDKKKVEEQKAAAVEDNPIDEAEPDGEQGGTEDEVEEDEAGKDEGP